MKEAVQFALRCYKRFISPMLPHACRFVPTCSEYAIEAIEHQGMIRGSLLAASRLLRCHPFARAGYDPPPQPVLGREPAGSQTRRHNRPRGELRVLRCNKTLVRLWTKAKIGSLTARRCANTLVGRHC